MKYFSEFFEPFWLIIKPKEEMVEKLIYIQLIRSTNDNLGLPTDV